MIYLLNNIEFFISNEYGEGVIAKKSYELQLFF